MPVKLVTPAAVARLVLARELCPYPLYCEEVLKNFDAMLVEQPTPLFDKCERVKNDVLELIASYRDA